MESNLSRRDFLHSAARTTAGLSALGGITFFAHPERVFGANDRVRVAVCGLHGRGKVGRIGMTPPIAGFMTLLPGIEALARYRMNLSTDNIL